MKILHYLSPFVAIAAIGFAAPPRDMTFPAETVVLTESPLPGYALASAFCYTCHSVEYIAYQPPASPRAFWKTQVTKMQKTFGAPVPDDAIEPIVDYLVKTYGAERAAPSVATPPPPAPAPKTGSAKP